MRFQFIDEVVDSTDDRLVAVKRVGPDEPALADHFPTFPILPGVLMLEIMIQAARRLLADQIPGGDRYVLSEVRALKYGAMVKPGMALRVAVERTGAGEGGAFTFKGSGRVISASDDPAPEPADAPSGVSGRFTLRPINVAAPSPS
jgi:3-hydroxymyristoyl/3-hydroxydecanoyl-(acyl carrier protein) dehydratase